MKRNIRFHPVILIAAGILCGFVISGVFIIPYYSGAAPYRPPPPKPEPPLPPPEEGGGKKEASKPKPPSPTPCVPNLCTFGDTPCCISPMCILLGQTSHDPPGKNRCPEAGDQVRIENMHTWVESFLKRLFGRRNG